MRVHPTPTTSEDRPRDAPTDPDLPHRPRAARGRTRAAKPHFVVDYQRAVAALLRSHPVDEAMSLAVGGGYEHVGRVETAILRHYGLADGMALLDFGCGSGRLAHAVSQQLSLDYVGIDVVPDLLAYARTRTPRELPVHRQPRADSAAAGCLARHGGGVQRADAPQPRRILPLPRGDAPRAAAGRHGGGVVHRVRQRGALADLRGDGDGAAPQGRRAPEPAHRAVRDGAVGRAARAHRRGGPSGGEAPWGEAGPLGQSLAVLRKP